MLLSAAPSHPHAMVAFGTRGAAHGRLTLVGGRRVSAATLCPHTMAAFGTRGDFRGRLALNFFFNMGNSIYCGS